MQPHLLKTIIWFIVATLVSLAVQTPMIWHGEYYFLFSNLLIVFVAIVSLRNAFEFYSIGFHRNKWLRYCILVFNLFVFIYLINRLEIILGIIDGMDVEKLITSSSISFNETVDLLKYIKKEYLFFSMASFVGIIIYNLRLLASFWKNSQLKKEQRII